MKPATKSFLKSMATLTLAFIAFCIAAAIHLSSFAPDTGVDHYAKLKLQGVPLTKAMKITNPTDHICVLGDVNSVMWTVPSGPPAYLFDPSGKLVDYTLDVGDSFKFQHVYRMHSGTHLMISEVEAQFASSP